MDIFQLRYFISAAALGNFSLAAAENNISQSSFSKNIQQLESELGVELFSRKRRLIELTKAGQCFLSHAYSIMSAYNQMRGDMARFVMKDQTVISLGAIPVLPQYHITESIIEFRALRSQVAFSIMEAESAQVLNSLRRMDIDFAVTRTDFLDPALYNMIPLVEDRLIALMSETNPLAQRERIELNMLKNERLILATTQSDLHTICVNACQKAGFTPSIGYEVSGKPDITIDIVRRGQAICLSMEKVMSHYPLEGCRIVPLAEDIRSTTALVWLKSVDLSPSCRMFKDFMMVHMHP